jgi:hypothetical protein
LYKYVGNLIHHAFSSKFYLFFIAILLNMKFIGLIALSALVAAIPTPQFSGSGSTESDLEDGPCKGVTFIMARASTERGNMVSNHFMKILPPDI